MLTLKITSNHSSTLILKSSVMLDKGKLTIGRAVDNDWVLPDPKLWISRYHCVIEENNGQYGLLDISGNGVFIGDASQPVGHGNSYVLCQGDRLLIGDYQILVVLDRASLPADAGSAPLSPFRGMTEKDLMDIPRFVGESSESGAVGQSEVQPDLPPSKQPLGIGEAIPWGGDIASALREVLLGAGLDPDHVVIENPAATLRLVGEVLHIVVAGTVDLLKVRRALKREFGLTQTEMGAIQNNPLKFSLSAEETLKMLIGGPRQGYLEAGAAFEEAFTDLKIHQLAVLAGTQEVWNDLFKRFDPLALEERIGEDRGLQGLFGSKKIRCWDAFKLLYQTLVEEAEDNRQSLFVRKFAKAYGEQMAKLEQPNEYKP